MEQKENENAENENEVRTTLRIPKGIWTDFTALLPEGKSSNEKIVQLISDYIYEYRAAVNGTRRIN